MCGIALIVSGIQIQVNNLITEFVSSVVNPPLQDIFSVDDIKMALHRRGPDSIHSKKMLICSKKALCSAGGVDDITPVIHELNVAETDVDDDYLDIVSVLSMDGESCGVAKDFSYEVLGEMYFIGATLQLRGTNPISQPLLDSSSGNIVVYNGEIFGGLDICSDSNDGESLMQLLGLCCSCRSIDHGPNRSCRNGQDSVPQLLSRIKGPWALIYWQNSSKTLWFGRDAFGRRSLLVHWPTPGDSRLMLSSVSPLSSKCIKSDIGEEKEGGKLDFWEELSCGIYSMSIGDAKKDVYMAAEVKRHPWTDDNLEKLIQWKRTHVQPPPTYLHLCESNISSEEYMHSADTYSTHLELGLTDATLLTPPQKVLVALKDAVFRRTSLYRIYKSSLLDYGSQGYAPVAVLFSGGLDSMILAALLDQCLDAKYEIDLLNVSFDGLCAPDRITARAGVKELMQIAPSRRWNLVEVDADLPSLTSETKHVMSLISPSKTYMDLNIGVALWLAAGGDGCLYKERQDFPNVKFKSKAKILLVGSGADEQCAGYGRHRTSYRRGSWLALDEEMQLDMQRIWKRNLGRDDRCIADNGKEARFPFLDEDVIRTLLDIPLWEIADLDQPSGIGDKKILRKVAQMLGLSGAAVLPKRAIQFGSRIARESNRKNFGSNRAANQASAGSVEIHGPSSFSSVG